MTLRWRGVDSNFGFRAEICFGFQALQRSTLCLGLLADTGRGHRFLRLCTIECGGTNRCGLRFGAAQRGRKSEGDFSAERPAFSRDELGKGFLGSRAPDDVSCEFALFGPLLFEVLRHLFQTAAA